MLPPGYEIALYKPEDMPQVVLLLHQLFGGDLEINREYFRWKYHDNPYSEIPLGIVAFYKDKVVGFRGYFALRWHIRDKNFQMIILSPGDTYVNPHYRMKGLSVSMGHMAMEKFSANYQVFLNTSAVRTSVPGYLKMGFVPIADKTYMMRYSLFRLLMKKFIRTSNKNPGKRIECGKFDTITVSEIPYPKEMAAVIYGQGQNDSRLTLLQDEEFFRWRFNNRKNRYVFYYFSSNSVITGYLVMLLLQDDEFGYIIDFAGIHHEAVHHIIRHIISKKHVDTISIPHVSLSEKYSRLFKKLGFKAESILERRIRKVTGTCPFLVRPVKRLCSEDDWHVRGLDIRDVANWHIKGICNDGF